MLDRLAGCARQAALFDNGRVWTVLGGELAMPRTPKGGTCNSPQQGGIPAGGLQSRRGTAKPAALTAGTYAMESREPGQSGSSSHKRSLHVPILARADGPLQARRGGIERGCTVLFSSRQEGNHR